MDLLPYLDTLGIPVLAVAFIILFRAHRHSVQAYESELRRIAADNEELRKKLSCVNEGYLGQLERMRSFLEKAYTSIDELHARRALLLSLPAKVPADEIKRDVEKIGEAIDRMHGLMGSIGRLESVFSFVSSNLSDMMAKLFSGLGSVATEVGDIKSRAIIISAATSENLAASIRDLASGSGRGLVMEDVSKPDTSLEEKIHSVLENLQRAGEEVAKVESTDKESAEAEEYGPLLLGGGQDEQAKV